MPDSAPESSEAQAYLLEAQEVDLMRHPGDLLEVRRRRLNTKSGKKSAPGILMPRQVLPREEVEGVLRDLREQFYELDPGALALRLGKIDAHDYPDLERYKKRLERVADIRLDLADALSEPDVSVVFIQALQKTLILPQKEAAKEKRRLVASAATVPRRRKLERSANLIRKHYPEIVAVDPDFFDQIGKAKKTLKDSKRPATIGIGIGIYIAVQLAFRLYRLYARGD